MYQRLYILINERASTMLKHIQSRIQRTESRTGNQDAEMNLLIDAH